MTNTGNIEVVEVTEHEDGSATYHFDLDDESAKMAQELGLKLMLYCGFSGVSLDDAFKSILDRADYLNQEPDLLNRFDEYGVYDAGAAEQSLRENNPIEDLRKALAARAAITAASERECLHPWCGEEPEEDRDAYNMRVHGLREEDLP